MPSIAINQDGSVRSNANANINQGSTAGQAVYAGREQSASYNPNAARGVTYTGSNARGANYSGGFTTPTVTAGGGGATYSSYDDYANARAAIQQQQAQVNSSARKRREEREGITRADEKRQDERAAAAGLSVAPLVAQQEEQVKEAVEEKKRERRKRPRQANTAPVVSGQSIEPATDERVEATPSTIVEPTEVVAPEPVAKPRKKAKTEPKQRAKTNDKMAATMRGWDETEGGTTKNVRPSELMRDIDQSLMDPAVQAAQTKGAERARDKIALSESLYKWTDDPDLDRIWSEAKKEYGKELVAKRLEERYAADERAAIEKDAEVPGDPTLDDAYVMMDQDLGDAETEEEQFEQLLGYERKRHRRELKEAGVDRSMKGKGYDVEGTDHKPWMDDEGKIERKFREVRDMIVEMLVNPYSLRIESEHVETTKEGRGRNARTRGRVRASEDVENALRNVKTMYGCTYRTVRKLIILRGGIGVDMNKLIGGKSPKKFRLSDAQVIELCRDIEKSQRIYGHPFGLVDGKPGGNGVRDNSGKFVVVAGTRCFPLGYAPKSLLEDLRRDENSILHGKSVDEIQTAMGKTWLGKKGTYEQLLANTQGNLLWQARAIENMMRAVMSLDGINPGALDVPEIAINRSLMQMAAEKSQATSEGIRRANEFREQREREANERMRHKYLKENGTRGNDGSISSPSRRRFAFGDFLRGVSHFEMACKTADIFLWITSPIEAMQSMTEQHVGEALLTKVFDMRYKGVSEQYKASDRLLGAARSDAGVEARSVAESLFRIGGWPLMDAFLGEQEGKNYKYRMTFADLRRFLNDYGITGGTLQDSIMRQLGIQPGKERVFMANAQGVLGAMEGMMLGTSSLFKEKEAEQFARMAMMEMARSSVREGESYTNDEVEQWAERGGGEEMIRSLLRTDAGREAFMTQGITSLGRKSPWDFAVRQAMAKNGLTELLVRTCFDRFPEYGMNKIMRQVPYSNTMSYLVSYGVDGIGRMMELVNEDAGQALQRVGDYQAGRREGFVDGLLKNVIYDTVMGANRLMISGVWFGVLQLLGGVHLPPKDDDEYNWSEYVIGEGEDALPIRWAWFMDDLSGIGLPLGVAWAICAEGDWSPEARTRASRTFLNAVANFNDGTAVFDAIDLFNNFDDEMNAAIGNGETGAWLNPSRDERRQTSLELMAWKTLGDMTPTIIKQILPWSRDSLFRQDYYARSASREYDTPEYSMQEAQRDYRTKQVDDYREYMRRREAQNNPIAAAIMDWMWNAGEGTERTGYKFTEQPLRTEADELSKLMWDRYSLEGRLSRNPDEAQEQSRQFAEYVCQEIAANFKDPTDAISKGFILEPTARSACQEYCSWMLNHEIGRMRKAEVAEMKEKMGMYRLPDDVYDSIQQTYDDMWDYYKMLNDEYFSNDEIPWRIPRYTILDSDYETRYVDENGNAAVNPLAANFFNAMSNVPVVGAVNEALGLGSMPVGTPEEYSYGNIPTWMPLYSPQPTEMFNEESRPYWVRYDRDGNLLTDTEGIYDMLTNMATAPSMTEEQAADLQERALELRDNLYGDRSREAMPTLGKRGREPMEQLLPEGFKTYYDPEQASELLGFDAYDKDKDKGEDEETPTSGGGYNYGGYGSRYYPRSYGRSYGSYGRSGGGYSSSYNPKIYSNARNVNGSRAAGLSTRQPYKATSTYLRPNFYTKGSREAYKRSDI